MAKSSFYSGTGVTPENTDVDPVAPSNITAIEDSKSAAQASADAAAASAALAESSKNSITELTVATGPAGSSASFNSNLSLLTVPRGDTGATGSQGLNGADGADGADSTVVGPQGPQGPQGTAGNDGADSTVAGPQGPQGPAGANGADGNDGAQGIQGIQGPQGPVGPAAIVTTANVTSAGALMDSEVTNLTQVKAFDSSDYATAAQGTKADSAVQPNDSPTFGTVTATSFSGDGSALTGLPAGYTNSDLDAHLNISTATANQHLSWTGSDYAWVTVVGATDGGSAASVYTAAQSINGGTASG